MTEQATDTASARNLLRWAGIVQSCLLLLAFAFMMWQIIPMLTETQEFLTKHLEKSGQLEASFAVSLEYESYLIRVEGIQIALGFTVGLLLCVFGLVLFTIGVTDAFQLVGSNKDGKITL